MRYSIGEFAKLVGVSVATLRRWDSEGILQATRSLGGTRYYTEEDLHKALRRSVKRASKRNIIYCRVSSPNQKDDLLSQVQALEMFALGRGLITETITEIGGGLDYTREKLLHILTAMINGEVSRIIIAHPDRLVRFGFELIDHLAKVVGCEIIVLNRSEYSVQQELLDDVMALISQFALRLPGLNRIKSSKDLLSPVGDPPFYDPKHPDRVFLRSGRKRS